MEKYSSLMKMKSCLIKEIMGFLKPYEIRNITTINKNKKFFRILLENEPESEYKFKSRPENFKFNSILVSDAISEYHLPDLMKVFKYLEKDTWLLFYISKLKDENKYQLKMYCLKYFRIEKIIFSSKEYISCINHFHFLGEELILITNHRDIRIFGSRTDFGGKLLISKADKGWILTGCLFQNDGKLQILSSINDNGPIKLWDDKGKLIKSFGNENLSQVIKIGVETFEKKKIVVCISSSFITIYDLNSGKIFRNFRVTRGFSYIYHNNIKNPIITFVNGSKVYYYSINEEKIYKVTTKNQKYNGLLEWNDNEYIIAYKGVVRRKFYFHLEGGYTPNRKSPMTISLGKFFHDSFEECYVELNELQQILLFTYY